VVDIVFCFFLSSEQLRTVAVAKLEFYQMIGFVFTQIINIEKHIMINIVCACFGG